MDMKLRVRVAVADRDDEIRPARRPKPTATTVWATRPHHTGSGRRLLAFRVSDDGVEVLVAGSPPRWVPAETMLSMDTAKRWLAEGFKK
jgi:hypothetical protein